MKNQWPLSKRPLDLVLVGFYSFFVISSFFFDSLNGLDLPLAADAPHFLCRLTYEIYAKETDPLLIANPPFVQYATFVSAFVCGPLYLLFIYGMVQRKSWIRVPALMYSGALIYSMIFYIGLEFHNPANPEWEVENGFKFLAFNGPYLLIPILTAWRFRKPHPFG